MTIKKLNRQLDALQRDLQTNLRQRQSLLRSDEEADTEAVDATITDLKIRINRIRATVGQKQNRRKSVWKVIGKATSAASKLLANRERKKQTSVEGLYGFHPHELSGFRPLPKKVPMGEHGTEWEIANNPATGMACCVHHDGYLTNLNGDVAGFDAGLAGIFDVDMPKAYTSPFRGYYSYF